MFGLGMQEFLVLAVMGGMPLCVFPTVLLVVFLATRGKRSGSESDDDRRPRERPDRRRP